MSAFPPPDPLPAGLPAPEDDGGARHLFGLELPPLALAGTDGGRILLNRVATGRWVLFVYPLAGAPGAANPTGWDDIPGARGCSQEACSFRDQLSELHTAGAERVLGLSSDATAHQQALVARLHLPYPLLSDPDLALADLLALPTFATAGKRLYRRLTLVLIQTRIDHVFYPVFPPDEHAPDVVRWLRDHPTR